MTYSFLNEEVCIIPHYNVSSTPNLFLIFKNPVIITDVNIVEI